MPNTSAARLVRDVMRTSVVSAHEQAVYKEIVNALQRNRISSVPVIDTNRRVVGVVSESDLLTRRTHGDGHLTGPRHLAAGLAARRKARAANAAELMTSPPVTVTPDTTVDAAALRLAKARVHQLPVVDQHGVLVGIVGQADLLRPYVRPDSEIADEIRGVVLAQLMLIDPASVAVVVDEGVVTLTGRVESRSVVSDLLTEVHAISGVVDVVDRLHPTA